MTPPKGEKEDRAARALRALYPTGPIYLTEPEFAEALGRLRGGSPSKAKWVERALGPYLQSKVFVRRRLKWYDTSAGTRARLALLPGNPHMRQDVDAVRGLLGIPAGQICPPAGHAIWEQLEGSRVPPKARRRVAQSQLITWWKHVHRHAALGYQLNAQDARKIRGLLGAKLCQVAEESGRLRFTSDTVPEWLRHAPVGPAPYQDPAAPLDWAVGRVAERHKLPYRVGASLEAYILTQNDAFLTGLDHFIPEVDVVYDVPSDLGAFTVLVRGVDEYTTKGDWDRIWKEQVQPRQEWLWEQRGMAPKGRVGPDIRRLGEAIVLYRAFVEEYDGDIKALLARPPDPWLDADQETLRRLVAELDVLLRPAE